MEATEHGKQDDSAFAARVIELVTQWWRDKSTPMLLSRLGGEDGGEIAQGARARAGSLKDYLREQLEQELRVLEPSFDPLRLGAVPAQVAEEGLDVDELFGRLSKGTPSGQRFQPAFWAAFKKPLEEQMRRFVSTDAPIRFRDFDGECPKGFVEIGKDYIADDALDDTEVVARVRKWLRDHGLPEEAYLQSLGPHKAPREPRDLLDRVLDALDPTQRQRITMPLDVVHRLRQERP